MVIIRILGIILVIVGLFLTTNIVSVKINKSESIGWALASLGMFLFFVYSMICGNIISAIVSLIFTIINVYFSVNYFKQR